MRCRALADSSNRSAERACLQASRSIGRAIVGVRLRKALHAKIGEKIQLKTTKRSRLYVFHGTKHIRSNQSPTQAVYWAIQRRTGDLRLRTACCPKAANVGRAPTPTRSRQQNPARVNALTELVPSFVDELSPLSRLLLPLRRQLDVVPACKPVLQVPLRLTVPAATHTRATNAK